MRRVMGALLSSLLGTTRAAQPVRHATAPAAARYFIVGDVHGCLDELHDLQDPGVFRAESLTALRRRAAQLVWLSRLFLGLALRMRTRRRQRLVEATSYQGVG